MIDTEMHATIQALYEGVFEPAAWQRSLGKVCASSDSVHAALVVLDRARERVVVNQVVNPVPEETAAYHEYYRNLDPAIQFTPQMSVGSWYIDSRELGERVMKLHPFYGEFFRDFGLSSIMACLVERRPDYEVYLSLQRGEGAEHYSPDDARALDWVIPHVRQAIALRSRNLQVTTLAHVSNELLDRLPFGVMVLDEDGRVMLTNRRGESWVRRLLPASGLGPAQSAPYQPGDEWRLSRPFDVALRAVCDPAGTRMAQALRAQATDGRQAQVILLPLPPEHRFVVNWTRPTVLVAVHDGTDRPFPVSTVLRDLFALTPAEARLATLLTTGVGLPEACEQLAIRRETSRTQLKSVFHKTGTRTQAQLAHLLTRLGVGLVEGQAEGQQLGQPPLKP